MKCVICKGDDIRPESVKEELRNGQDIVLIPVTVSVCQSCGERYYDLRTMRLLEEAAQKLREQRLELFPVGQVLQAV